jgi:hypothetical protein
VSRSQGKAATDSHTFDERFARWQKKRYHGRVGRNIVLGAMIVLTLGVVWLLLFPR